VARSDPTGFHPFALTRAGYRQPATHAALGFGVILPVTAIITELAIRMWVGEPIDPFPTPWHLLLALTVPAANLALWQALRSGSPVRPAHMAAAGAGLAIAAIYVALFGALHLLFAFGLIIGIGLIGFGPLAGLIVGVRLLNAAKREDGKARAARFGWAGAAAGVLALLIADAPLLATGAALRIAAETPARTESAMPLLRVPGARSALLRAVEQDADGSRGVLAAPFGMAGELFGTRNWDALRPDADTARLMLFRSTGEDPDALLAEASTWRRGRFFFDRDQGGTTVGGRVPGLALGQSEITGRVDGRTATADLFWTMRLRNDADRPAEARMTIALPPGAVVSGATLWVAGEPREAVFASRAAVRRAYEQIVRVEARDPLLVTTMGADRVLAQAFPVPARGDMKLRLRISAPLALDAERRGALALPTIVEANFNQPEQTLSRVEGAVPGKRAGPGGRIMLAAADPAQSEPLKAVATDARGRPVAVTQRIVPVSAPEATMIVLDGSLAGRPLAAALIGALDAAPPGSRLGLAIATERPVVVPPAPWSPAQRDRMLRALASAGFRGGENNRPALLAALSALKGEAAARVLWLHGPQPVAFRDGGSFDAAIERTGRLPQLTLYQPSGGPNRLLTDNPWFWQARSAVPSSDTERDLRALIAGARWRVERVAQDQPPREAQPAEAVVRLWAADRAATLAGEGAPRIAEAKRLAGLHRIVTPLVGAVVLETDADYQRTGLAMAVPAPGAALLFGAGALALALFRRRALGRARKLR